MIKRGLTIEVPESDNLDHNPDFKTPVEYNAHRESEYSTDGKSEDAGQDLKKSHPLNDKVHQEEGEKQFSPEADKKAKLPVAQARVLVEQNDESASEDEMMVLQQSAGVRWLSVSWCWLR